jgi:hypothetical protein
MKITGKREEGIFLKGVTNWAKIQMLSGIDSEDIS